MMGAAVVLALAGMVFPIALLLLALLFDLVVVAWVLFAFWYDHWSPRLVRYMQRSFTLGHVRARPHRHGVAGAH